MHSGTHGDGSRFPALAEGGSEGSRGGGLGLGPPGWCRGGVGSGEPGAGCPVVAGGGEVTMYRSRAVSGSYRSRSFQPPFQVAATRPILPSGVQPGTCAVRGPPGSPVSRNE